MLLRNLLILSVIVLVSACSSTKDEAIVGDQPMLDSTYQREGISDGMQQDGVDNLGYESGALGSYEAGSVEEFVNAVGDRVFFETNRYELNAQARSTLEAQAAWMKRYPNINVTVEGHADERGTREYNLALGERRANSIENYLVAYGIDPRRLHTLSYGKERPAVPGADQNAWNQNRRGVTRID